MCGLYFVSKQRKLCVSTVVYILVVSHYSGMINHVRPFGSSVCHSPLTCL